MKRTTKQDLVSKLIEETEAKLKHLTDLVETYELDVYIDGHYIKGGLVDESDDITPEQVAIIGAYTSVLELRDNFLEISQGKEAPESPRRADGSTKKDNKPQIVVVKEGKIVEGEAKLPEDIVDQLKKIIEDQEK